MNIETLQLLFRNTLPVYYRETALLSTRYVVCGNDFSYSVPRNALMAADLNVFDGQSQLSGTPMLHGKWRRNGLVGVAPLVAGLSELLSPGARKDDAALVLFNDSGLAPSESGMYFRLFRLHIDKLPGWEDEKKIALLLAMRRRTTELAVRVQSLLDEQQMQAAAMSSAPATSRQNLASNVVVAEFSAKKVVAKLA